MVSHLTNKFNSFVETKVSYPRYKSQPDMTLIPSHLSPYQIVSPFYTKSRLNIIFSWFAKSSNTLSTFCAFRSEFLYVLVFSSLETAQLPNEFHPRNEILLFLMSSLLLGWCATKVGSSLPTFRHNMWIPTSRVKQSKKKIILRLLYPW
jgi:hypothetical protein